MDAGKLDATFAALSDPTRRAMLVRLAHGEASVNEVAAPFNISLPAISRHLKVLERAGLISRGRNGQFRPCRLEPELLDGASDWIDQSRQVWTDRLDKLAAHLHDLQRPPPTTEGQIS